MKNLFKSLSAILGFALGTGKIFANGFTLADQDAFAAARGDAFVATADNPSAIYYNPAGIAQLDGDNFRGGAYGIYLNQNYTPPQGGNTYNNTRRLAAVPQGFFTHTFNNSALTVGLGVYAPYGGSINWPSGTGFATVATQGKLTYLSINPTMALKLAPGLFIGGGLTANYADLDMRQWLATSQRFPNTFEFNGSGWSMGYNLGVLLQPIKQLSFGATFRSTSTTTFEGNTTVQTPVRNSKHYTLPSNMSLTFPLSAVVGVSYRPTPNWNLEFDACYTEWSSFKSTTIYIDEKGTPLSSQGVGPRNPVNLGWQDSWIYELGVTRYLGKGWHASAGYAYDENSVPDTYYTPLAADLNRNFFSTGVGFDGKVFDFDLTYQFGYGPKHTVTGSSPSATPDEFSNKGPYANGTYGFISQAIMVSAGIHF